MQMTDPGTDITIAHDEDILEDVVQKLFDSC